MWICPICETKNSDNDSICQCCQQPRPKPEPQKSGKWALLAACAAALALVIGGVTFFTGRETDKPRMAARSLGSEPSEDVVADEKNKCGENAFWTLENGTLTISGSGAMEDYVLYYHDEIPAPWGDHKDKIKEVIIEDGITSIGAYAFYECESLAGITIPDSVMEIGAGAFQGCGSLTIYAPAGSYAWRYAMYCGIAPADEPAVNICGENAYWTLEDGTLTISGQGPMSDFTSPAYAPWYSQAEQIETVVIEEGITTVGSWAFESCAHVTEISLPDSLLEIKEAAFYACGSLKKLSLPHGVKAIGDGAFYGCGIQEIEIPESVTNIDGAFYCSTELLQITVPGSVKSLGSATFSDCLSLKKACLDEGVEVIGDHAFSICPSLTEVILPKSIKTVGEEAFLCCSALEKIALPEGTTTIGSEAFSSCDSLKSITIPDSVTEIGDYAFAWCESLTSITIPASATEIGADAFDGCDSLTIYAPAGSYAQSYAMEKGIPFAAT